jgi:hypothetical protein
LEASESERRYLSALRVSEVAWVTRAYCKLDSHTATDSERIERGHVRMRA